MLTKKQAEILIDGLGDDLIVSDISTKLKRIIVDIENAEDPAVALGSAYANLKTLSEIVSAYDRQKGGHSSISVLQ